MGCKVISEDKLLFKHKFIKFGLSFLIFLNSGKYLPACLIIHIGLTLDFLPIKTFFNWCHIKYIYNYLSSFRLCE